MVSASERKVDKSTWGVGAWSFEPDEEEFIHAGQQCFIWRHPSIGHWCGYVAIPEGHPWHQKPYEDIHVEVHYGLTFGDKFFDGSKGDTYWLGFDCAHSGDYTPYTGSRGWSYGENEYDYKDIEFVKMHTKRLAEQVEVAGKLKESV